MSFYLGGRVIWNLIEDLLDPNLAPLWRCWLFIEGQQLEFNPCVANHPRPRSGITRQRSPWDDQQMLSWWFGSPLWKGLLLRGTPIRTPNPPWAQTNQESQLRRPNFPEITRTYRLCIYTIEIIEIILLFLCKVILGTWQVFRIFSAETGNPSSKKKQPPSSWGSPAFSLWRLVKIHVYFPKNPWDVMGCHERRVWCFHRRGQDS